VTVVLVFVVAFCLGYLFAGLVHKMADVAEGKRE
jgi:hypothetical protein